MSLRPLCLLAGICIAISSCDTADRGGSRGAIVLGDPATIVTETDSQYLRDFVADARMPAAPLQTPPAAAPDTDRRPDTAAKQVPAEPPAAVAAAAGLNADFGEIRVFIPGIEPRTFSSSIKNKRSAAYQLASGRLAGNQLQISGSGKVDRVSQRYETDIVYRHELGVLVLEALHYTSGWQTLKGNATVRITGLEEKSLHYTRATPARIRTAVTRAARGEGFSRKKEQEYLDGIRNIRSANQKPLDVELRTVIWQITGKDSKGKTFHKELRIDMPV